MKRIIAFICTITMLMLLCSCSQEPKYYNPSPLFFPMDSAAVTEFPEGREPTDTILNICGEILENLSNQYNIEKELPQIRMLSGKEMAEVSGQPESIVILGSYSDGILYVVDDYSNEEIFKATIAHELMHYLSDNGNEAGCGLRYCSQGQLMGQSFDEGVTNYLSTAVYPFPEDTCIYEFETHVAEQFAIAVGQERLEEVYFNSDIVSIKEEFDNSLKSIYKPITMEKIKLSPFDILTCTLTGYNFYLGNVSMNTLYLTYAMLQAETVEEMLMFYGESKGAKTPMQDNLREFLADEYQITWTYYTRLSELTQRVQ